MIDFLETFDFIEVSFGGPDREDYRNMFGVDALDAVLKQLSRITKIIEEKKLNLRVNISVRTHDAAKFMRSKLYEDLPKEGNVRLAGVRDNFFSWGGLVTQDQLPYGARLDVTKNATRVDCTVPWASLSINVDGTVVGCGCVDWNAKHIIGNVFTESLVGVWKSDKARAFRTAFSSNQVPDMCRTCTLYHPIDSGIYQGFARKPLRDWKPVDGLYYLYR